MNAFLTIMTLIILSFGSAAASEPVPICGSVFFERDTVPPAPEPVARPAAQHTVGETEQLWVYSFASQGYDKISFTYRAVNEHSYVLVADNWWNTVHPLSVKQSDVDRISYVFEMNAGPDAGIGVGVYDLETATYAAVEPIGGDAMTYILLCGIASPSSDTYIAGYVSPTDRYSTSQKAYSNYRNIIYLDVSKTSRMNREVTLAHEFTHILQGGVDPGENKWVDEGIAVYSQTLCGYSGNSGKYFFEDPSIGLYEGVAIPGLAVYDMCYMLMQFVGDQYGAAVVGEILRNTGHGITGFDNAFSESGHSITFADDVFPAWSIANLRPPDPGSPYAYHSFDPTAAHPADFGTISTLPADFDANLKSYGLRYIHIDEQPVQGSLHADEVEDWMALSVNLNDDTSKPSVRPWYQASDTELRDCGLNGSWMIVSHTGPLGTFADCEVTWHEPEGSGAPAVTTREPSGNAVSPYRTPFQLVLQNLAPDAEPTVTITGARSGPLNRSVQMTQSDLAGTCGMSVAFTDDSGEPWPGGDTIRVSVQGEIISLFGESINSDAVSWEFVTTPTDDTPPNVTLGLLAGSVLPNYLTALVFSDEPLYSTDDNPVRLLVNGTETVELTAQNVEQTDWVGSIRFPDSGTYSFNVVAEDIAGNPVSIGSQVYAVVLPGESATARIGSAGRLAVSSEVSGLVTARIADDRSIRVGPDDGTGWQGTVSAGVPLEWLNHGNALVSESGTITALTAGTGTLTASEEYAWAVISEPGTYRPAHADVTPPELSLGPNRPNPFNPVTTIPVTVPPGPHSATFTLFNAAGQKVREYTLPAGRSEIVWDAKDAQGRPVAAGMYVGVLSHAGARRTIRLVVAR